MQANGTTSVSTGLNSQPPPPATLAVLATIVLLMISGVESTIAKPPPSSAELPVITLPETRPSALRLMKTPPPTVATTAGSSKPVPPVIVKPCRSRSAGVKSSMVTAAPPTALASMVVRAGPSVERTTSPLPSKSIGP